MDSDLIFETETSDMSTGSGTGDTQLAAVSSAAAAYDDALPPHIIDAAQVEIPQGENVVRVPVTPGEVVELPFPDDSQFLARIDNGNLAIKVGDVTVILQGYVEAAGQAAPVVEASNGQPLDIATILASTDPNIDIQTAAGPAVGAQGADNTGAILAQFGEFAGLGGFNGVGALDATDPLGGGTVDQTGTLFVLFGETLAVSANVAPVITAGLAGIAMTEDDILPPTTVVFIIKDPDDTDFSITLDQNTLPPGVTYDPVTHKIAVDAAGHYDYLAPGEHEVFTLHFTVTDAHGGSTTKDVYLSIDGVADTKDAVADNIFTNVGTNAHVVVPEWALIANDKDASTEDLGPNFADKSGLSTVVHNPGVGTNGTVDFLENGKLGGSIKIDDTDGSFSKITLHNQAGGDFAGSDNGDVLVGGAGGEKIEGKDGNDIIFGGGGADDIFGGKGDDIMVYAAGAKFHGGFDTAPVDETTLSNTSHGDVLALVSDLKLADSADAANIDGIETISMSTKLGGVGAQSLTIGAASIQQISDHALTPGGVFTSDKDAVRIDGDAVDNLYLSISKDGGSWADTGKVVDGFHVYAHETTGGDATTTDAYAMVAPAVTVHLNQDQP